MPNDLSSFSVHTLVSAVKNNLRQAIITFVVVMTITTLAILFLPRTFRSDAMLFVRLGRESVALDPTANTGSTISVFDSRDSEVNSVRDMLHSRRLLEHVVDSVGPKTILGKAELGTVNEPAADSTSEQRDYNGSPRQTAIKALANNIKIFTNRKSYVLSVQSKSSSPELSQKILKEFLAAYQLLHSKAHQTPRSHNFFSSQAKVLKKQWDEAMDALKSAKDQSGIVSLDDSRENMKKRDNETRIQWLKIQRERESVIAMIDKQQQLLKQLPARMPTLQQEGMPNAATDAMRNTLYKLEITHRNLLAQYSDQHPKVRAIETQIEEATDVFEKQSKDRRQVTSNINPTVQDLQTNLSKNQAKAAALEAEFTTLENQITKLQTELKNLNKAEVQIRKLEQDVNVAETNYAQYRELQEQTRIGDALLSDQFTNVKVVQSPTFDPKPVGPKKKLIGAAGLVLALSGAILLCLVRELFYKNQPTRELSNNEIEGSDHDTYRTEYAPTWHELADNTDG